MDTADAHTLSFNKESRKKERWETNMSQSTELSNLIQIRAFCQVVDQGSVSAAASELHRTQSAVTRSINDLEHHLNAMLFERHAKGMRLTDFGRTVLSRARRAIHELDQIPLRLQRIRGRSIHSHYNAEPLYLFNVRRLQIFISLCETGHMPTVATRLGMSQSAVSASMKVLEQGAGQLLMERTSSGMRVTPAGTEIQPYVRRVLNELMHIPADIAALRGEMAGCVRIGALAQGRTRLVPQAIVKLTQRYPSVKVVTNESAFATLVAELRSGEIDFIFGALRSKDYAEDIVSETLLTEELAILVRQAHPLAAAELTANSLCEARWIFPPAGTPERLLLDENLAAMGFITNPIVESSDLAVVRGLLLNSDMVAAVSARKFGHELKLGTLVQLPLRLANTRRQIGFTFRVGSLLSPAANALVECLREAHEVLES